MSEARIQELDRTLPQLPSSGAQGRDRREVVASIQELPHSELPLSGRDHLSAPVVEAKRRMYEVRSTFEGGAFDFEFPEFYDAEARIASKNIEAWGLELLSLFRRPHEGSIRMLRLDHLPFLSHG